MTEQEVYALAQIPFIIIAVFFALIIFVGCAYCISEHIDNVNELKRKMYCSDTEEEYKYWRRELRICRLCVIPFVTPRVAKAILRIFGIK